MVGELWGRGLGVGETIRRVSDLDVLPARASGRSGPRRLVVVIVGVVVLLAASAIYFRVGWSRMKAACTADPPGGASWTTVNTGWSWSPLGFQCTYDDGHQRNSLWF